MYPNIIPERKEYSNNKWGTVLKFYSFGVLLFQEPSPKSRTVVSLELSGRTLDFIFYQKMHLESTRFLLDKADANVISRQFWHLILMASFS